MNTKCNTCGAPQHYTENSKCIYCGEILKVNEIQIDLLNDFIPIKYEYNQENFEKVIMMADSYLLKDSFNIPCWAYKITSEFLKAEIVLENGNEHIERSYNFNKLINSLDNLLDLKITNNLSIVVIENLLQKSINKFLSDYNSRLHPSIIMEEFINFSLKNFSNNFNDFLKNVVGAYKLEPDELFKDAARLIVTNQNASETILKRSLNISNNQLQNLLIELEKKNVIGLPNGNNSRDVKIKSAHELNRLLNINGNFDYEKYRQIKTSNTKNILNAPSTAKSSQKPKNKKGNCFIATATMGSYDHPVVMDLRIFRDEWLLKRNWGVRFTNWYYTHGPKAAKLIEKSTLLKRISYFLFIKPIHFIASLLSKKLN
jgi:hypothetical protein